MEQHRVVSKALLSLKLSGLIDSANAPDIRPFLNQVWVAGWEEGRLEINQHTNKKIAQYDRQGNLINIFKSTVDASKKTGYSVKGIYKALKRETPMKKGWVWRYVREDVEVFQDPF